MVNEIEVVAVSGQFALSELMEAIGEAQVTGFHPVLLGDSDDYDRILEGIETGDTAESILQESNHVDLIQLVHSGDISECDAGEELDGAGFRELITHLDPTSGMPKAKVLIRSFKVPAAWHAFAHLAWGGWNSSPPPKVHCAVHRHWAHSYGANVVSITSSAVQCTVAKPPTSHQSALELARHQFAYCGNMAKSPADLARKLLHARFWHFCWD